MKNVFEKIKTLKTEILSVCLIVLLFVLLNGHGTLKETFGSGEVVRETEEESGTEAAKSQDKEAVFFFRYQDGACTVSSVKVPGIL